jgi:hypothetical protein
LGLEIGALDRPLMLPRRARAFYLDRFLPSKLREHYPELDGRRIYVSLVSEGEELPCIRDGSLSFVVANHVIEHCEDPIATLTTFSSKLQIGGIVFMAVPDMRRTFDHARPETPWQHLLADHQDGSATSRMSHYREWATIVECKRGDAAEQRAEELQAQNYSIHYHCWTEQGFRTFLDHIAETLPLRLVDSDSWRNENIFVLRKV